MRKFEITNTEKFTGTAAVMYNEKGTLCMIDCRETNMNEDLVNHFKRSVPSSLHMLLNGSSFSADTIIVEADYVVTFEQFYNAYPLKRNRYKAEIEFNKLSKTNQVLAFNSLHGFKIYCSKNTWYTPLLADTYLRARHYETDWKKVKSN